MSGTNTVPDHVKCFVTRRTQEQYKGPITSGKKVMAKVKFFKSSSNFKVNVTRSKIMYHLKCLVTSNRHVQYETCINSGKKVSARVEAFVHAHMPTLKPTAGLRH